MSDIIYIDGSPHKKVVAVDDQGNPISGPGGGSTGGATETTLQSMSAKLPASLGAKPIAESLSMTVASNQTAIPTSVSNLPTDFPDSNLLLRTPTLGQKDSAGSTPVAIANDQSTVSVGTCKDIDTPSFSTYPVNTNLITGTLNYVSLSSIGSPQAIRFALQILGTYTNFSVSVNVADDANGTNATPVQLRYISSNYSSAYQYNTSISSVVNQMIETTSGLIGKFIAIVLTTTGTGGGSIRIRRLSALATPVYTQTEVIPVQSINTQGVSGAYSFGHNVHPSNILGHASANSVTGPSDSDRRAMNDGVTPMFNVLASPWSVIVGLTTYQTTVNFPRFSSASGAQSVAPCSPNWIGLVTLELQVAVTGSGGAMDIDFMYENGVSASVFAKPFPRITSSGTYTTTLFVPRNSQQLFLRYSYVGSAGSTFNVTAPNWIRGSHYGPEMYKNIFYDYTALSTGSSTSQTIDLGHHKYAKRIMFIATATTGGTITLSYDFSLDGTNWIKISGSETVLTAVANRPLLASMNNGLSPISPLRFIRVTQEVGSAVLAAGSQFFISN